MAKDPKPEDLNIDSNLRDVVNVSEAHGKQVRITIESSDPWRYQVVTHNNAVFDTNNAVTVFAGRPFLICRSTSVAEDLENYFFLDPACIKVVNIRKVERKEYTAPAPGAEYALACGSEPEVEVTARKRT